MFRHSIFAYAALSLFLAAPVAEAQQEVLVTLPANDVVQNDLGVTDEQKVKLKAFDDELRKAAQQIHAAELPNTQRMAAWERNKFLAEQAKGLNEKFLPTLKTILTPEQCERLQQIGYQVQRADIYSEPRVVQVLGLSEKQREKIAAINSDYSRKVRELIDSKKFDREANTKLIEEQLREIARVLTAEQAEKLAWLLGKPIDLSTLNRASAIRAVQDLQSPGALSVSAVPRLLSIHLDMIRYEAVRKDLKLSLDEEAGIVAAIVKWDQAEKDVISEVRKDIKVSLKKREDEIWQAVANDMRKILHDSHIARLNQIRVQRNWHDLRVDGPLYSGGLIELGLSGDQLEKMRVVEMEISLQKQELRLSRFNFTGGLDNVRKMKEFNDERKRKLDKLTQQQNERLLEALTQEQRSTIEESKGPPFDISIFKLLPSALPNVNPPLK